MSDNAAYNANRHTPFDRGMSRNDDVAKPGRYADYQASCRSCQVEHVCRRHGQEMQNQRGGSIGRQDNDQRHERPEDEGRFSRCFKWRSKHTFFLLSLRFSSETYFLYYDNMPVSW